MSNFDREIILLKKQLAKLEQCKKNFEDLVSGHAAVDTTNGYFAIIPNEIFLMVIMFISENYIRDLILVNQSFYRITVSNQNLKRFSQLYNNWGAHNDYLTKRDFTYHDLIRSNRDDMVLLKIKKEYRVYYSKSENGNLIKKSKFVVKNNQLEMYIGNNPIIIGRSKKATIIDNNIMLLENCHSTHHTRGNIDKLVNLSKKAILYVDVFEKEDKYFFKLKSDPFVMAKFGKYFNNPKLVPIWVSDVYSTINLN